ncbi:uncharacterized protein LACBIDRAFT_298746 [Laccaria bicolor S238N-H82]|uniref:Predicted protein n=1 Tax=Laccaria bicolor (strain S238N-H82 / ATCC MYA-4686) TaxID=486041 RepID=B0DDI5_LACBS|nr:uncharacterized protein LACBIDRAFT_298746 [Laccaria bicolor S238N-H82]EDR07481.1 predicted protein [Laccaria bicolor S238N-H82]|eukprot:XP_001881873.1 predicted protein [Laccaria bicolor S238N-H82]
MLLSAADMDFALWGGSSSKPEWLQKDTRQQHRNALAVTFLSHRSPRQFSQRRRALTMLLFSQSSWVGQPYRLFSAFEPVYATRDCACSVLRPAPNSVLCNTFVTTRHQTPSSDLVSSITMSLDKI